MILLRICLLLSTVMAASAQVPGMMFPWWDRPIVKDLGLSDEQLKQIRTTVERSRDRIGQLREAIDAAEVRLKDEMNASSVDSQKAEDAIEKVIAARSELTRAISQMSLKLRLILTTTQWEELQKRQPRRPTFDRGPGPPRPRGMPPTGGPERFRRTSSSRESVN